MKGLFPYGRSHQFLKVSINITFVCVYVCLHVHVHQGVLILGVYLCVCPDGLILGAFLSGWGCVCVVLCMGVGVHICAHFLGC